MARTASSPRRSAAPPEAPRRDPNPLPHRSGADISRAAGRWIADGRSQGWSVRTLNNRQDFLNQFAWWMRSEAKLPATLGSLSPTIIRALLAYSRCDFS